MQKEEERGNNSKDEFISFPELNESKNSEKEKQIKWSDDGNDSDRLFRDIILSTTKKEPAHEESD